jgi:hypothetical protein
LAEDSLSVQACGVTFSRIGIVWVRLLKRKRNRCASRFESSREEVFDLLA